jgi:16S rRNA (guanine527-N7)-methyltransferase
VYLDLLARWSARVNLTGARTAEDRVQRLVGDVLPAVSLPESGRLIDVGSGNGSPGLVFALLRDDLEATLLEPRVRRWAFLAEAARAAGRSGVLTLRQRHDEYRGVPARTVTQRALSIPPKALAPLVEPGGTLLVFGVEPAVAEPFTLERRERLPQGQLHLLRLRAPDVSRET